MLSLKLSGCNDSLVVSTIWQIFGFSRKCSVRTKDIVGGPALQVFVRPVVILENGDGKFADKVVKIPSKQRFLKRCVSFK